MTLVSYAQNGEDVRVWRALGTGAHALPGPGRYVDVGANDPRELSVTASLYDLGWRGVLIEADPDLAALLARHRPGDVVVNAAASAHEGEVVFHRVPGTGLGTLDDDEAAAAAARGFAVDDVTVPALSLDAILDARADGDVHFMSVDVEGAEEQVLAGLTRHRPWILCVEAVVPGTSAPSHHDWEPGLLARGYRYVAFDGVNRWYVADEHADLADAVATPFNAIDAGEAGWVTASVAEERDRVERARARRAWQRELILNDRRALVPPAEYERQIDELRTALVDATGSRSYRWARKASGAVRGGVVRARAAFLRLPAPVTTPVTRRRHLRHVEQHVAELTDPAYLGSPPTDVVDWLGPGPRPAVPLAGCVLGAPTSRDLDAMRQWIAEGPYDTDAELDARTDNHGDEVGRTLAALRLRIALAERTAPTWAGGDRVLVDARSLQTRAFGQRGIGRFARAALLAVRSSVGDERVTLLVDRGLEALPDDLAGACEQVTRLDERVVPAFGVLVQPSPMTASALPLLPLLGSNAHKVAIAFDLIPLHYPTVYLRHPAARAEYAAALDALRRYDEFVCISHTTVRDLQSALGMDLAGRTRVAWPRDVLPGGTVPERAGGRVRSGPIVVMTGDEPRKNTFGALAGVGAATVAEDPRDVVVVGMAGQDTRVHHWSIAAAMRPGEARTLGHVADDELTDLLASARVVVVDSFDEGLSLPVIEALRAGAPVVASDIPAHRELIGSGAFLADPARPASLARVLRRVGRRSGTARRQWARLAAHEHEVLEDVMAQIVTTSAKASAVALPPGAVHVAGRALRIGIATPWVPQATGVADFSTTTTLELARLADVCVYTTSSARVEVPEGLTLTARSIDDAIAGREDVFVSVVGNSHFHVPFIEVVDRIDSVVVSHDARLVELYLALRGRGGVEELMLRGTGRRALSPPLDDQIDDMRLLENAGFWEVARRALGLVLHSPTAAARIATQTGVVPTVLPFANQRAPRTEAVTDADRAAARERLGFAPDLVHLGTFGYVDLRTKLTDVVVEAAAWLTQWGHRVALHVVGAAAPTQEQSLRARAADAGIERLDITGFASDEVFRDHLLAVDLGVQLRISPMLGVSGPLSDLAAFGTPSVASRGLAIDVDTPDYVERLPDDVSPVLVAEAIERLLARRLSAAEIEPMRREYLAGKSPRRYAEQFLAVVSRYAGGGA